MKKLFIFAMFVLLTISAFAQGPVVDNTGSARTWYFAQDSVTVGAGDSINVEVFTNSFFNAMIYTADDSLSFKIGTWANRVAAVDQFIPLLKETWIPIPSIEGVKDLTIIHSGGSACDASSVYIMGDKYVTE